MPMNSQPPAHPAPYLSRPGERGSALPMAVLVTLLVSVVSISLLATVSSEGGIAGSDLQRTRTFYAAQAGMEKMTNGFSGIFARTVNPTQNDLDAVANDYPTELFVEGFNFEQQFIQQGARRSVVIPHGSFAGLNASVVPYTLTSTVRMRGTDTQVALQREMNNYLVPIFQFGIFSDDDIELHPGPAFYMNGRVHANGNIYVNGNVTFLSKVTTANEAVIDVLRNGSERDPSVKMRIGNTTVNMTKGSVNNGPNLPSNQQSGGRGIFPGHPAGTANSTWEAKSVSAADGTANQFGGQLLTRTTGARQLLLPFQLNGAPTREIIKRRMPGEEATNNVLSQSRYHTKASIRILLDDENQPGTNAAGIPAGRGVNLSTFVPGALGGGRALARVNDNGTYVAADVAAPVRQKLDPPPAASPTPTPTPRLQTAATVRGVHPPLPQATPIYNTPGNAASGVRVPSGAGLTGRILIEIVPANGAPIDVTQAILSMGVTQGEPNGIVYLQRPLWASYVQGSRDRTALNNTNLVYHTDWLSAPGAHDTRAIVDGEVHLANFLAGRNATHGYSTVANNSFDDDPHTVLAPFMPTGGPIREAVPCPSTTPTCLNRIVPINLYNVREGAINNGLLIDRIYERGITSIVELNMRNLARWVVGTYDGNLLAGTQAVSTNINAPDGYIVYVSDRRGDKIRTLAGVTSTNGNVDNEDIYGPNNSLDPGEDANGDGVLNRDLEEMPNPAAIWTGIDIYTRAENVASWMNLDPTDLSRRRSRYFRRAVRLFNGENLQVNGPTGSLSQTRGITMATENMVYIWGNYNTAGINSQPAGGATLNDGGYAGPQVPASIISDAFFPLSKTWFDSSSALYPQGNGRRLADAGLTGILQGTSVRAAIMAGTNLSALQGNPDAGNGNDSRLSGGLHNFPRFLEDWLNPERNWNFVGSFVPLYRSTQALGPWQYPGTFPIYGAPIRNWAFDNTFTDTTRLPPGTPLFQYIEPTGFRQLL